MSESITGYIDHIIFRNEDNGYTVMVLKGVSEEDELTCVGSFPVVTQGASVELEGNFTQHPVYGKQFQAVRLTEKMPEDALAMERYLGSGAIKGIGAALAGRIVRHFGDDTFQIVENEPERLSEVKGISEKKAREIAMQIAEKSDMRKAMMFLQKYGISLNLGAKIYQKYGDSVYSVLQENPYRLADDISGVGFKIADEIAYRIGIHTDSDYRIKSGMVYTLLQATGEGHVYLPKDELFQRAAELLGVDSSYMEKHLVDLAMDRKIVQKEQGDQILIYPAQYYYLELNTARMLRELDIFCPEDEKIVERRIVQIEKETGTVLDEMQKKAVQEAAGHGLLILTGGPGTGKSTFIKILMGLVKPDGGTIDIGETVRFGYYSQDGLQFDEQMKVIDVVQDIAEVIELGNGKKLTASQFLQHFLFTPETQHSYVYKLSGGERRRLYLCTVLMRNPNFLVLDEPTNDLDIITLNVLEEYLQNFKGCVIVVSHDRYFMDKVVDHLLVFNGQADIRDFPGNYTQYRDWKEEKARQEKEKEKEAAKPQEDKTSKVRLNEKRRMSFKEKREFEQLEQEIAALEEEKASIETALCSGTLSVDELTEKSKRLPEVTDLIDEKTMRWLELSEIEE